MWRWCVLDPGGVETNSERAGLITFETSSWLWRKDGLTISL